MMKLDPNSSEFIALLHAHKALPRGWRLRVALHGHPRYTADLAIWLWMHVENSPAVLDTLHAFGVGDLTITTEDGGSIS